MNFNKLTKYCYRFSKSVKNQNRLKTNEYAEHLKYYIQRGGDDPTKINEQLSKLSEIIKQINSNPKYNLDEINKKLQTKTGELSESQAKIIDLSTELENLKKQLTGNKDQLSETNDKLVAENTDLKAKIAEIQKLLDEEKEKNKNDINALKAESDKLQKDVLSLLAGEEVTDMPEEIKQKILEAMQKIKNKDDKTAELTSKATELEASNNELAKIKEKLETEIAKSKDLNDEIARLKARITELEGENKELNNNFIEFDKNKANRLYSLINELLVSIFGENIKNEIFDKVKLKSSVLEDISSGKTKLKPLDEIPEPVTSSEEKKPELVSETSSEQAATSDNSSEGTDNNIKPPKFQEGDRVKIIKGDYEGKYGEVLQVHPKNKKGKIKFQYTIKSYSDNSFDTEKEILENRISENYLKKIV
jgi:chromosome segregation ATPase